MRNFPLIRITVLFTVSLTFRAVAQEIVIHQHKDSVHVYQVSQVDSITFRPCFPDSLTVVAIAPNSDCITPVSRPAFTWELLKPNRPVGNLVYELTVVEMAETDTTFADFGTKTPVLFQGDIKSNSFTFPSSSTKLEMGKIYAWRVRSFEDGKLVAISEVKPFYIVDYPFPFNISDILCCTNTLLSNGALQLGLSAGALDAGGTLLNWHRGYGSPAVRSDSDGCNGPGYVQLEGNKLSGSSIKQNFPSSSKIIQGKHYRFSACVRLRKGQKRSDYVLVKAVAFNSSLPATGTHPQPNSDLAVIGWTGKLTLDEWGTASVPAWKANKDFDNIAVYCYTNSEDTTAYCDIDNICMVETTDTIPCDDFAYDGNGNPIIDTALIGQAQDTTYNYYEEYTGLTSDLYSSQGNTALDTWYPDNDPCASVGGFVPTEIQNMDFDDTLSSLGFAGTAEELDSLLAQTSVDTTTPIGLPRIQPLTKQCDRPFVPDPNMPFSGRDIIFVHGLKLQHLCDRGALVPGAMASWPTNPSEFIGGGYYKILAEDGWADHIKTWLTSRGYKNRYLIVAYNCSQPLPVAAHAVLSQIRDAMENGTGVVFDPSDTRKNSCFGQSSVMISHSTGGLVGDVSMSIAEKSKIDPVIQGVYGNVGFIPDHVKAHIAFHPALEGSKMASLLLRIQEAAPTAATLLNSGVCHQLSTASVLMSVISHTSILIDLQPAVVSTLWNPFIHTTPVPTITIAGGHPFGVDGAGIANWAIHPGLDDGVVTMSSQTGNPNFETGLFPSGYWRTSNPFKVYDMGISIGRANSYYMHQTLFTAPGYIGGASVTHLSPTGMVQPVSSTAPATRCENRYANHYSFLQSASDHYTGPRGKSVSDGFDPTNFPGSSGYQPPNYRYADGYGHNDEESRSITDLDIYARGLVSPAVATMQYEHIRGLNITIPIPIPNLSFKCCPPKFKFWWSWYYIVIPIWERKYHNMVGYQSETECSYVYKYVLRP
jgi:hypothetical protein